MKSLKASKGITLLALVIIIIILLILVGISISALTNQGLFIQAQNAKNLTEEKTAEENAILSNYLEQMNAIIGGQVTESVPDGAVVTPINDITTWLKTAGISKQYSYTTIEQVIADSTCTKSLMNNENAMKYLARSTEFADAICASETTMTYLGQSAYVDDTVLNSDLWVSTIYDSTYMENIFYDLVPTMTSNSENGYTIECDYTVNYGQPYKGFDKVIITDENGWGGYYNDRNTKNWVGRIIFPESVKVYFIKIYVSSRFVSYHNNESFTNSTDLRAVKTISWQGSNNGNDYEEQIPSTTFSGSDYEKTHNRDDKTSFITLSMKKPKAYKYQQFHITDAIYNQTDAGSSLEIGELILYGRSCKP